MRFKIEDVFLASADENGRERMRSYVLGRHGNVRGSIIARSILSRPIEAYFIGKGKRYILVTAAHHSLESITANFAFTFIDYLLSKNDNGSVNGIDCKFLLSNYTFIVITCVNPDGVELRFNGAENTPLYDRQMRMSGGDFSTWQANARGVDLNHNYDAGFAEYKAIEREEGIAPGPTLYSGEYPESEPEAHGVANLVRTLMPYAVVSLHTQGEEIYAHPRSARVLRCAEKLASMTGYVLGVPSSTAAFGGLADYTGALGIPSFTIELGKGKNPLDESLLPLIFPRVADAIITLPSLL